MSADLHTFDTERVDALIDEFDAAMTRITSTDVEVDDEGRVRHNDPNKAEISRELLRAADLAEQMASEVRSMYWGFKGFEDPRDLTYRERAEEVSP